ncbi:MAG: sulfatase-like hydrolase/transferase [Thalassotalea sp.]
MKKNTFIGLTKSTQLIASVALCLLVQSCSFSDVSAQKSKNDIAVNRPNIVIIFADDMGIGDLGVYNANSKIPTPNMDAIANNGIRFTDAHTASAVCTPSRYGLLTGRYAWRTKLKTGVLGGTSPALIEEGRMTIQSMLQKQGYATAGIGKWHLGLGNNKKTDYTQPLTPGPISSGFDYYFGIPASLDMAPYVYFENEKVVQMATETIKKGKHARNGGGGLWRAGAIAPDFKHMEVLPTLATKAESYIAERGQQPQQPFFLYMPLPSPHTPWIPTDEFRGTSKAGVYGDFVYQTDDVVGRVVAALQANGLADNTLIIVSSDNGSHWRESEISKYEHLANGQFRGMKADIYEAGHRVPFVAAWPNNIPAGSVSDENLSLVDLLATFAALTDAELPNNAGEDSYNQLTRLMGDNSGDPIREATVYHSLRGMFALQQGPWKFIDGQTSGGFAAPKEKKALLNKKTKSPAGQLYNLAADPSESNNLYSQQPEKVAELKALLYRYQEQGYSRSLSKPLLLNELRP